MGVNVVCGPICLLVRCALNGGVVCLSSPVYIFKPLINILFGRSFTVNMSVDSCYFCNQIWIDKVNFFCSFVPLPTNSKIIYV